MEIIHEIIVESVSGGFWKFCGYVIMNAIYVGIPCGAIVEVARVLKRRNPRR